MNEMWAAIAAVSIAGFIAIGYDNDRRVESIKLQLERSQGQVEGLQMQLEKSRPSVNVTQNNETNGVKIK